MGIYRVNPFCPHCGEEHNYWDIALTEEEQAALDQYYESRSEQRRKQTDLANLIDDVCAKPLQINRKLRCCVCEEVSVAKITVFREDEIK